MKRFCLGYLLCIALYLHPLDVYLNNTLYRHYAELDEYLYPLQAGKEQLRGVSLDEILPVLTTAWQLEIVTPAGTRQIVDKRLADKLAESFLCAVQDSWTLILDGRRYSSVERLTVCGEAEPGRELSCWVSWEGIPRLKEEIGRFARLHNIKIKTTDVPQIDSKLLTLARAGAELPDVVMIQSDYLPALTGARCLQSVGYMRPAGIMAQGDTAFTLEGSLWAIPFYCDTQLLFYNPVLCGERLPPGYSLTDLERVAAAVRKKGVIPLCWNVYSAYWLISFQLGFGKQAIVETDGRITVNDPATQQALEYLLGLKARGLLEAAERDAMVTWFASGQCAMILSGSYSIPAFEELGIPFAAAPYPVNGDKGRPVAPLLDFKGWAITRKTKHPVLARRLIEFLSGVGVQQRFAQAQGKLPANSLAWPLAASTGPWFALLQKSAEQGAVLPPAPAYPLFKNTMWKLLRFIFAGTMTIEETLAAGQAVIDGKLGLNDFQEVFEHETMDNGPGPVGAPYRLHNNGKRP